MFKRFIFVLLLWPAEQVKVAREALNVLKHSTPTEGEYGRALQKTISESLAKLQGE